MAPYLRKLAAIFIVLALAVRIAIPSGWMPSSEKAFALAVCTGIDTHTVWLDKQGKLHKEDPSKGKSVEHSPCVFSGSLAAGDFQAIQPYSRLPHDPTIRPVYAATAVEVGHGLAAPPPPSIGPPNLI